MKRTLIKIISSTLIVSLLSVLPSCSSSKLAKLSSAEASAADITVYLEGNLLEFDQPAVIIDDRVMVPMRSLFEGMGYGVEWDDDTKTATAVKNDERIHVKANYNTIRCENAATDYSPCDVLPQIISGRMLIPLRAFSYATGCHVYWNENNRQVIIYNWQNVTDAYSQILNEYKKDITLGGENPKYFLYDIDKTGVPELIVNQDFSEGEKQIDIYTYDLLNKSVKYITSTDSGHSSFGSVPNENGIMMLSAQMGYENVQIISLENDKITSKFIIENKYCVSEYDEPDDIIEGSERLDLMSVSNSENLYSYYL